MRTVSTPSASEWGRMHTEILQQHRILIVGVVRNSARGLRHDIGRLHGALMNCRELHWLIIESDSSDQTVDVLSQLQSELANFRFLSLNSLRLQIPIRSQRLAYCRNIYLGELDNNPDYQLIDYVVVADLDGVNNLITS